MNIAQIIRTLALALVLVLTATGLWAAGEEEQPAAAADKQYVTDPVTGKVFTAPEYGGTLIYVFRSTVEPRDAWFGSGAGQVMSGVLEKLGAVDWAIDRDIYHFVGGYAPPLSALTGALAVSGQPPFPNRATQDCRSVPGTDAGLRQRGAPPTAGGG